VIAACGAHADGVADPIPIEALLDAGVLDAGGAATTLRAHLGPRATVVVFLRHYG
jgi:hypothetical protein